MTDRIQIGGYADFQCILRTHQSRCVPFGGYLDSCGSVIRVQISHGCPEGQNDLKGVLGFHLVDMIRVVYIVTDGISIMIEKGCTKEQSNFLDTLIYHLFDDPLYFLPWDYTASYRCRRFLKNFLCPPLSYLELL